MSGEHSHPFPVSIASSLLHQPLSCPSCRTRSIACESCPSRSVHHNIRPPVAPTARHSSELELVKLPPRNAREHYDYIFIPNLLLFLLFSLQPIQPFPMPPASPSPSLYIHSQRQLEGTREGAAPPATVSVDTSNSLATPV